jgi:hypothetical protein
LFTLSARREAQSGPPEPGRKRIGFLERGQFLWKIISLDSPEHESAANENKEGGDGHTDSKIGGLEILTRNDLRVDEEESPAQQRQGEEGQKDGADFRRLGHDLILGPK